MVKHSRFSRHRSLLARIMVVAVMLGMIAPRLAAPAPAAAQGSGLPETVLMASVRIMTDIRVIPDKKSEDPFICTFQDELLDYSVGSGTIISADGYILTNHHVVDPGRMPREIREYCEDQAPGGDGTAEFVQIVWLPDAKGQPTDPYLVDIVDESTAREDLAVLKMSTHLDGSRIRGDFPFVTFGDSDLLREPEKIITIGYPANAGNSRIVSEGIFSGWADNGYGVPWIYTDATISGGNSGGTAVNSDGYFIGIPTQSTFSDCRPGDTNSDGVVDENDQGCIGLGGNFGMLIPSNIARTFAEEATGESFEIGTPSTTPSDEPTVEPTEEETPEANQDGPAIGEITLSALDENDEELDTPSNVASLQACFDNNTISDGDSLHIEWLFEGEVAFDSDETWDSAWDPTACATLTPAEDSSSPYLDPGVYSFAVTIGDETFQSDEIEIVSTSHVDSVEVRGRDTDRQSVDPEGDNVLAGEIVTITATVGFTDMTEGDLWEAQLVLGDEIVWESGSEAWSGDATGTETLRMRHADEEFFPAGTYELVITVDGVETSRTEITIDN